MAYTTVIAALAASKRATAGNTIFAEWGAAAQTDIEALALNAVLNNGSTKMTGTLEPSSDLGTGLGSASFRFGSAYINILELSTRIGMGGAEVLTSGKELVRIAGLSTDATPRKLVVDLNTHKYLQLFNPATFDLLTGMNDVALVYPSTQPGTGIRDWVHLNLLANAAIDPYNVSWHTHSPTTTQVKLRYRNDNGGTISTIQANAEIVTTQ